jgi:DNA-binding MarR family transcriptional regulator
MSYVNLIAALSAAEKEHGLHTLDALSKEILQMVGCADMLHQKIRVSDIIRDGHTTFPTVITHLRKLTEEGWLVKSEDPSDRRVILLHITPKTQNAFDSIYDSLAVRHADIKRNNCAACIVNVGAQAFTEFEQRIKHALAEGAR